MLSGSVDNGGHLLLVVNDVDGSWTIHGLGTHKLVEIDGAQHGFTVHEDPQYLSTPKARRDDSGPDRDAEVA